MTYDLPASLFFRFKSLRWFLFLPVVDVTLKRPSAQITFVWFRKIIYDTSFTNRSITRLAQCSRLIGIVNFYMPTTITNNKLSVTIRFQSTQQMTTVCFWDNGCVRTYSVYSFRALVFEESLSSLKYLRDTLVDLAEENIFPLRIHKLCLHICSMNVSVRVRIVRITSKCKYTRARTHAHIHTVTAVYIQLYTASRIKVSRIWIRNLAHLRCSRTIFKSLFLSRAN